MCEKISRKTARYRLKMCPLEGSFSKKEFGKFEVRLALIFDIIDACPFYGSVNKNDLTANEKPSRRLGKTNF